MVELTPEAIEMRRRLLEDLPAVVARKGIDRLLGGLVSSATLANFDSRFEGPKNALNVGDNVAYYREDLVEWLVRHWSVTPRKTLAERLKDRAERSERNERNGKPGRRPRGFVRA